MNTRKVLRLKDYDYSQNGAYFITVCVNNRLPLLSEICPCDADGQCAPVLSETGSIAENAILLIPTHYENVSVDNYVIMPNHIHLLVRISNEDGRAMPAPASISKMIQLMKGYVTKQCGRAIWQKSFYDHIVRNEQDYLDIWQYIDENPYKWSEDEFFVGNNP